MKCGIDVIKDMRGVLKDALVEAESSIVDVSYDGTSSRLAVKFYNDLYSNVRNPDLVLERLEARLKAMTDPLHLELIRNNGEEVLVDGKKMFILESYRTETTDDVGGFTLVLKLADADTLKPTTYKFTNTSDSAVVEVGNGKGTIEGISEIITKTAVNYGKQLRNEQVKTVNVDTMGVRGIKPTLNKMVEVDQILGSKQDRTTEDLAGYEEITDYEHGDVDSMKEILNRLHVLGNSKASAELMAYYTKLLDRMHPRFFNQLKLFYKTNDVTTQGSIDLDGKRIFVESALSDVEGQSEAEVYIHEVIHSMTSWALRQNDKSLTTTKSQLANAIKVAKENTVWQDFLNVPESQATEEQVKEAKQTYEYIFISKNAAEEFIAYSLTNPKFMEKTKNIKLREGKKDPVTLFEKIIDVFTRIMDVVLGKYSFNDANISVFEQVNEIAFRLAEINNNSQRKLNRLNPLGKIIDVLKQTDTEIAAKLEEFKRKISNEDKKINVPGEDASIAQNAKFLLDVLVKSVTNPLYRGFFGLWFSAWGATPDSTVREVISNFFERDQVFRIAEKLNMLSNLIDATRNSVINAVHAKLEDGFTRKLTEYEDSALTSVLVDTGLSTLRYKKNKTSKLADRDIVRLLTDGDYRYTREGRLKHKIKELLKDAPERANWTVAQAVGLGYYLATHKAHIAQNFNANNIMLGYGLEQRFESVDGLVELVEELATLTALRYTDQKQKDTVAELIKKERKGINNLTDTYESYRKYSEEVVFSDGNEAHMMMGHSKELFDSTVDIAVAPLAERSDMEARGFTMKYVLPSKNGDTYASPMAMYTTPQWGKAERLKGTVGLATSHTRGTTMTTLKNIEDPVLANELFRRDFAKVRSNAIKLHMDMARGLFDPDKVEYGMAPVVNSNGAVTDFRYMMSKAQKKELLNQDTKATQVLSRSMAGLTHVIESKKLNERALSAIKMDMDNNWKEGTLGEDGYTEYALISKDATDPEMRKLYALMPDSFREFVESREDKTMAVRRDLLNMYFGYKHLRLTDFKGVKLLPTFIKDTINTVEGIWIELIKISKGAILMKMPLVLIENIVSNIRYMITTGSLDVVELAKDYRDSFREVNEYISTQRKLVRLTQDVASDKEALDRVDNKRNLNNIIYNKEIEIKRLQKVLESNPARELFLAGLYQAHVEDIETSTLNETNKITKAVNAKLEKAPTLVRAAADIAYITQNTTWYKVSQEVMQRTDMVARLVENKRSIREENRMADGEIRLPQWWLDERKKMDKTYPDKKELKGNERREFFEKSKEARIYQLMDNYVNYTMPSGRIEEYMNRIGVLMFTKYLKRIQKVVINSVSNHPLKSSISLMLSGMVPGYEAFQEQSVLSRAIGLDGEVSLLNIVPTYDPLYHLANVFTPAIVKDELYLEMF